MDDAAVAMLNKLHEETKGGIEIVVTSSWRLFLECGRLSVEALFNINELYVPRCTTIGAPKLNITMIGVARMRFAAGWTRMMTAIMLFLMTQRAGIHA